MTFKLRSGKLFSTTAVLLSLSFGALLGTPTAHAETALSDVNQSYAKQEIQVLLDEGILSGYGDGTFAPAKPMTRAELAKVLVLSLGLKEDAGAADRFADIPKDAWYKGFVGALVKSGITDGTSPTAFSPDEKVSRQQLAVFFVRAMGLDQLAAELKDAPQIADKDQVSDWAYKHIALALKIGFIQGTASENGSVRFNPTAQADRQALARLSYEAKYHRDTYIRQAEVVAKAALSGKQAGQTENTPGNTAEPTPSVPVIGGGGGGGSKGGSSGSTTTTPVHQATPKELKSVSNTEIEVHFTDSLSSVSPQNFAFDKGLQVVSAELKQGSSHIVRLVTASQASESYRLTYKGTDTGLTVTGTEQGTEEESLKVLSATAMVSGKSYPATIGSGQDILFSLPSSLPGDSMLTDIHIKATGDAKLLTVEFIISNEVEFVNGTATISITKLLGVRDTGAEGISLTKIRNELSGNDGEFGFTGTLSDAAGVTQTIHITIK